MTPLTRDDLEALSAYLDGALTTKERAALESRLAAEPELRTALDDLRLTVRIMRAAPRLVVPRNYTLDPARFARRAPWWTRLDVFRTVGVLGAAASTALIVLGVLLGSISAPPAGAPLTSTSNEVAMQASHTVDADAEQRATAPVADAVGQSTVSAAPPQIATPMPAMTTTPVADMVIVSPSPFPSPAMSPTPAPLQAGGDSAAASRQGDSDAADGAIAPAPGVLPASPAEPLTQPTLTALANYAAESFESGAGAPATSESPAALMGESGPALAAMATPTAPLPSRTAPPTVTGRFEATAPAATTAKAALPPVQMTEGVEEGATATAYTSPTPQATRIASVPLPTEEPSPPRTEEAPVENPLPRLLLVVGLGLLLVSAVTWLIGLARRSRP